MKNIPLVLILFFGAETMSCSCTQKTTSTNSLADSTATSAIISDSDSILISDSSASAITNPVSNVVKIPTGKTTGTISHQYKNTGCNTVIIVSQLEEIMTLIPIDPLPTALDKNGTVITFNYHPLKIKNPKGCNVGMPAEISDVEVKK